MGEETIDTNSHENGNDANNSSGFMAGLMVGGLAGAGAMLLLAPRSGKKTQAKIQPKGVELRADGRKPSGSLDSDPHQSPPDSDQPAQAS